MFVISFCKDVVFRQGVRGGRGIVYFLPHGVWTWLPWGPAIPEHRGVQCKCPTWRCVVNWKFYFQSSSECVSILDPRRFAVFCHPLIRAWCHNYVLSFVGWLNPPYITFIPNDKAKSFAQTQGDIASILCMSYKLSTGISKQRTFFVFWMTCFYARGGTNFMKAAYRVATTFQLPPEVACH